jgi:hypothetical protein
MYVRFHGKSFKLPDALTLGRGEPFDISDRTLARAHARLVFRNDKWKIKDLSTDCGVMINGQKIKSGKFHQIYPGDTITLGNVPLEIFESLPEGECTVVKNFTAHDITDYGRYIYGLLIVTGLIIAFTESRGDLIEDILFLAVVAAFLKLASVVTYVFRTIYFPMNVVIESNLTNEGVTFHITGNKNFSVRFKDIEKWFLVGKCFFITAYGKRPIFILNEGHDELATLLRENCSKKRAMGEPILEKLALLPLLFVIVSWISLTMPQARFLHFVGHGLGLLGGLGLMGLFFSEHLRELLPFPSKFSHAKQSLGLGALIAFTFVMQFNQLQGHYKMNRLVKKLNTCTVESSCKKIDFSPLAMKKLPEEQTVLLKKVCVEGNKTACEDPKRKPASH